MNFHGVYIEQHKALIQIQKSDDTTLQELALLKELVINDCHYYLTFEQCSTFSNYYLLTYNLTETKITIGNQQSYVKYTDDTLITVTISTIIDNRTHIVQESVYLLDYLIQDTVFSMYILPSKTSIDGILLTSDSDSIWQIPSFQYIDKGNYAVLSFDIGTLSNDLAIMGKHSFSLLTTTQTLALCSITNPRNKSLCKNVIYATANKELGLGYLKSGQTCLFVQPMTKMNHLIFRKRTQLLHIKQQKSCLKMKIKIPVAYLKGYSYTLYIQHRTSFSAAIKLSPFQLNGHSAEFSLDFSLFQDQWAFYYWDLYLVCENKQEKYACRVFNKKVFPYLKLQYHTSQFQYKLGENIIYPYQTLNDGISINYRPYGEYESYQDKKNEWQAVLLAKTVGLLVSKKKKWIIHEKYSNSAQDNSFYFFKYLRDNTTIDARFVIRKDSPERAQLIGYEKYCLDFMSIKHLYYLLISSKIISSESKGHGYAWRVQIGPIKRSLDAKYYVFLQHGVLGLKKLDGTFDAHRSNHANLFITSAEWEKEIVCRELHYSENEVAVTGLARWDAINKNRHTIEKKQQILLMPTWRKALEDEDSNEFLQSDFFREYHAFLTNSQLRKYLEKEAITLLFYAHPKFAEYVDLFSVATHKNIEIIPIGSKPLNTLLSESMCLITDYSSIYWEALYQNIPTLFFHFDLEEYQKTQGSYIDLTKDLNGVICYTSEELLAAVTQETYKNFQVKQNLTDYFPYHDNKNSERIFKEIQSRRLSKKEILKRKISHSPICRMTWKRLKDLNAYRKRQKR